MTPDASRNLPHLRTNLHLPKSYHRLAFVPHVRAALGDEHHIGFMMGGMHSRHLQCCFGIAPRRPDRNADGKYPCANNRNVPLHAQFPLAPVMHKGCHTLMVQL
jgi:hypothetical protein